MVNARTVSAVLALSFVAAPLLHAICGEDDEYPSNVDQYHGVGAFEDADEDMDIQQENLGEEQGEEEVSEEDVEEEVPGGEFEADEADEAPSVVVRPTTGAFLAHHPEDVVSVPEVEAPEEIRGQGEEKPDSFDELIAQEVPEAVAEPEPEPVVEGAAEPAAREEVAEKEEGAQGGFFDRLRNSFTRGFSALKARFSPAKTEEPKSQE